MSAQSSQRQREIFINLTLLLLLLLQNTKKHYFNYKYVHLFTLSDVFKIPSGLYLDTVVECVHTPQSPTLRYTQCTQSVHNGPHYDSDPNPQCGHILPDYVFLLSSDIIYVTKTATE